MKNDIKSPWLKIPTSYMDSLEKSLLDNLICKPTPILIKKEDCKGKSFMPFREIKKVIFNAPATVIIWTDNTKTVVKCEKGETYDEEKGFLLCWLKGIKGSKTLQNELATWVYNTDWRLK